MNPSRLLWLVLVPLLLTNAVLWAIPHWYWMSAAWLLLAVGGKKLFLGDEWNYR